MIVCLRAHHPDKIVKQTQHIGQNENDENGKMPIFARPYIAIDKDGDGTADYTVVADVEQSGSYSLLDILKAVDANWAGYESQQQMLKEHYATWKTWNVDWDSVLPNLAK